MVWRAGKKAVSAATLTAQLVEQVRRVVAGSRLGSRCVLLSRPGPQGLPNSGETRSFAADLLSRAPRKQADKARARRARTLQRSC